MKSSTHHLSMCAVVLSIPTHRANIASATCLQRHEAYSIMRDRAGVHFLFAFKLRANKKSMAFAFLVLVTLSPDRSNSSVKGNNRMGCGRLHPFLACATTKAFLKGLSKNSGRGVSGQSAVGSVHVNNNKRME